MITITIKNSNGNDINIIIYNDSYNSKESNKK